MPRIEQRLFANRWRGLGAALLIWTALGVFDATETVSRSSAAQPVPFFPDALALGLCLWYGWGLLSPLIFWLARRFPVEPRRLWRHVPIHLAAGAAVALVKLASDYPAVEAFYCPKPGLAPFAEFYGIAVARYFHYYFLIYWAILGAYHAVNYYRQSSGRALSEAQLEARLAQAQLQVLKLQLDPHFLFNTLNGISTLIHADPRVAERMMARLGDLLRLMLKNAGRQEVPLAQELEFLEAYLEIEQARFGPRMDVRLQVEPRARSARVPFMLLQPLVENAVRHGVARRAGVGRIEVRAAVVEDSLRLQVIDNGPGLTREPPERPRGGHGIGLANTRDRLARLYGDEHQFAVRNGAEGGLHVQIEIPAVRADSKASAV